MNRLLKLKVHRVRCIFDVKNKTDNYLNICTMNLNLEKMSAIFFFYTKQEVRATV